MLSLEGNRNRFKAFNTIPVGISVDSMPFKRAWARQLKIERTQLLCDFWLYGEVAKKYGLFRDETGFSERANIIVDELEL